MSYIIAIIAGGLLVAADQFTKWLAVANLGVGGSSPFIPGIIEFRYHINEGAAFGIFQGGRWVFLALTAVVLAALVFFYIKLPRNRINSVIRAAMTVVAAGAVGNAIDRAMQGYVVDFLNFLFIKFYIFNIADACLVCGTITLAILIIFFYGKETKKPITDGNPEDSGL